MSVNKQAARIKHHTSTTTGAFTVPASEDFTDGTWDKWDLAKSEIGVNEFDETVSVRIGANVYDFYTTAAPITSTNIGNSDLTISTTGARKLILGGAATSDYFTIRNSADSADYFKVDGTGNIQINNEIGHGTTPLGTVNYFMSKTNNTGFYVAGNYSNAMFQVDAGTATRNFYVRNIPASSSGFYAEATNAGTGTRMGFYSEITGTGATNNIGIDLDVANATNNYAIQVSAGNYKIGYAGDHKMILGGALSTDSFVVRNSADSSDYFKVYGDNKVQVFGGFIAYGSGAVTSNTALGDSALNANTTGSGSTAVGVNALLSQTTSIFNTAGGTNALRHISAGSSNNTAWGYEAGRFDSSGTANSTCNGSVFIGKDSRPDATSQTNQIVIGANARGNGSNTATIGDTNVTNLHLGTTLNLYQETTGVAAATFTANTSGIANDTATFDGYTIGQVVKALRNLGILA